jgi:flagellar motor switch protein FliM
MSHAVTADQISALLRSARSGERSEDSAAAGQRRLPRLRTVNFSRPTKFTSDQERRLSRLLESFCRTASSRLSAELRVGIELEVIAATQLTWSSALAQVPAGSVCAIVDAKPIDTRLLLTAELPYVLCGIEALLGAPPGNTPRERRLTDIDWALARRLFGTMLGQLSLIWQDVADVELTLGGLEASTENAQVAPFSEPTLALTLEARVGRTSSTLSLLVPYCAIAPVASSFSQLDGAGPAGDGTSTEIDGALRGVSIDMRAEVADTHMTVDEVLALRPGDVVRLDASASAGVTVYADEVAVHRARPGRSGRRRAVQVLGPVEDGSWASAAH